MKDKFFSHYEIISEGEIGNTYTVFRAKNISNGQPVTVKFLRGDLSLDKNILENYFIKEIESFRLLVHPNILKILDYGKAASSYYLVYEFFESRTLLDIFKAKEVLPVNTIEYIAKQIIRGLSHAANCNILHRDLKPLNILVARDSKVKISDFSILESAISKALSNTVNARRTLFLGSPLYISPEQALGLKIDFKSDIYSFGILLFEMLTGKTPFNSDTSWGLLYKHIKEIPPDLKKIKENIPDYLNYIFKRSLSKSQAKRFSSYDEILNILSIKEYDQEDFLEKEKSSIIEQIKLFDDTGLFEVEELKLIIGERKKIFVDLVEEVENLKTDLLFIKREYDLRIEKLYLDIEYADLKILEFKKILRLKNRGYSEISSKRAVREKIKERFEEIEEKYKKIEDETRIEKDLKNVYQIERNNIKKTWKQLALKYHPDFAKNKEEKEILEKIMKRINTAYDKNDVKILNTFRKLDFFIDEDTDTVQSLNRKLLSINKSLKIIIEEQADLKKSEWFSWREDINKATLVGEDLFVELEKNLSQEITFKERYLEKLKSALKS